MNAYIGLIGTIVGALIAGVILHLKDEKQRNFEKEKAKRDLLLEKYEIIFKELPKYSALTSQLSMELLNDAGYGGKFSMDEVKAKIQENDLRMNIMFYAPELANILKDIDAEQKIVIESTADFLTNASNDKAEKERIAGNATISSLKINSLTSAAQNQLVLLVKNITDA